MYTRSSLEELEEQSRRSKFGNGDCTAAGSPVVLGDPRWSKDEVTTPGAEMDCGRSTAASVLAGVVQKAVSRALCELC